MSQLVNSDTRKPSKIARIEKFLNPMLLFDSEWKRQPRNKKLLVVLTPAEFTSVKDMEICAQWLQLLSNEEVDLEKVRTFVSHIPGVDLWKDFYLKSCKHPLRNLHFLINVPQDVSVRNFNKKRNTLLNPSSYIGICGSIQDPTVFTFMRDIYSLLTIEEGYNKAALEIASGAPTPVGLRCGSAETISVSLDQLKIVSTSNHFFTVSDFGEPICIETTGNNESFLIIQYSDQLYESLLHHHRVNNSLPKFVVSIDLGVASLRDSLKAFRDDLVLSEYFLGVEIKNACQKYSPIQEEIQMQSTITACDASGTSTQRKPLSSVMEEVLDHRLQRSKGLSWVANLFQTTKPKPTIIDEANLRQAQGQITSDFEFKLLKDTDECLRELNGLFDPQLQKNIPRNGLKIHQQIHV